MPRELKKCVGCGLEFYTISKVKTYCIPECKKINNIKKGKCLRCKKPLNTTTGGKKYCSDMCRDYEKYSRKKQKQIAPKIAKHKK